MASDQDDGQRNSRMTDHKGELHSKTVAPTQHDLDQTVTKLQTSAATLALLGYTNAQLCAEVREAANVARDNG